MTPTQDSKKFTLVNRPLLELKVEAIVNPTNTDLLMGAGIAGQIRKLGGTDIQEDCLEIGSIGLGQSVVTGAGNLEVKYIIHGATMKIGGVTSEKNLISCIKSVSRRINEYKISRVAIPPMGTGVGRFPLRRCAEVMIETILNEVIKKRCLRQVIVAVEDEEEFRVFEAVYSRIVSGKREERKSRVNNRSAIETVRCKKRGLEEYGHTHAFQIEVRDRVIRGETDSVLISVRHPSVITIGRAGTRDDILADPDVLAEHNIKVIEVERGGRATYHGPGQAVMYPVFNLKRFTKDIHYFLRQLENVMIRTLAGFSLSAVPGEDTGVFIEDRKIGSIGIAVKRWVTWHGISLNVCRDPNFSSISPCGLPPSAITSMDEEGVLADISLVETELIESFKKEFNIEIVSEEPDNG